MTKAQLWTSILLHFQVSSIAMRSGFGRLCLLVEMNIICPVPVLSILFATLSMRCSMQVQFPCAVDLVRATIGLGRSNMVRKKMR